MSAAPEPTEHGKTRHALPEAQPFEPFEWARTLGMRQATPAEAWPRGAWRVQGAPPGPTPSASD